MRTEEVTRWAGMWMRVDKKTEDDMHSVAFDNMQDRPIIGTRGWQRYNVELFVPKDASSISFGIALTGPREVWLNSTRFEIVGLDAPAGNSGQKTLAEKPVNLEFNE